MKENTETSKAYDSVGVIGAGAWGTALAFAAAQAGRSVTLWAREAAVAEEIRTCRTNETFLPGVTLPETIAATGDIAEAARADALLVVVPAQHLRASVQGLT